MAVTAVLGVRPMSPALILSATSMVVACTCLGLLLAHVAQIHRLRAELREVKVRVGRETDAGLCGTAAEVPAPYGGPEAPDRGAVRMRRAMQREAQRRRQRQLVKRRRTLLHLLPLSSHSYDEEDETLLKWTAGHSQGEGLKLSGRRSTCQRQGSTSSTVKSCMWTPRMSWVM
ncbi:hypothetical protein COCON_G00072230 [Conger conger]|uniref:Uncharacterized protein n=1 Tax=Conger conger TaxID=82655 RepID=A0A9Q1DMZ1_CONCO|nr:hypothetical protein COCON_G00072230 [Conger conger]